MRNEYPIIKLERVLDTNIFYWGIHLPITGKTHMTLFFDLDNRLEEIKINSTMSLNIFISLYGDIFSCLNNINNSIPTNELMDYTSCLKHFLINRERFYINDYEFFIDDDFLKLCSSKPNLVKISKPNSNEKDFFLTIDNTINYLLDKYNLINDLAHDNTIEDKNINIKFNKQNHLISIIENTKSNKLTKKDLTKLSFKRNQRNILHCKSCFEEPKTLNEFIYENRCKLDITNYQAVIPVDGAVINNSNDILKAILNELHLPYYTDSSNITLFNILFRSLELLKTENIVIHSLSNKGLLNDTSILTLINCFNFLLKINFLFTDLIYIKSAVKKDEKNNVYDELDNIEF